MSLVTRTDHGRVLELQRYVEALLSACIDYHNSLVRGAVSDAVTGREELQTIYRRFNVELEPRSLYGEAPSGRIYDRDRRA